MNFNGAGMDTTYMSPHPNPGLSKIGRNRAYFERLILKNVAQLRIGILHKSPFCEGAQQWHRLMDR